MKAVSIAAVGAALVLSACAADPVTGPAAGPVAARSAQQLEREQRDTLTGSRIPARRTEKMVGQVGAKDYHDTKESIPVPMNAQ